jgi:3-oxoacyl-[acyl-carrier protein] reductase
MSEKVAVVTGSSRGIGRAIALRLAADGARVLVNYHRDADAAKGVVAEIESGGGEAVAVQADATDPEQLLSLFTTAEQHFGGLDVFVHSVTGGGFGLLADATDEQYETAFDGNARALFVVLRECAVRMRDGGRIVSISSLASRKAAAGQGLYSAGKLAGEQLVRTFAQEIGARGITANSVLPGAVDTDGLAMVPQETVAGMVAQTALGRLGQPEDVAELVGFLASDAGRWITGETIAAGGGLG